MSARLSSVSRGLVAGLLSVLLVGGALGGPLAGRAQADSAPANPADPATPVTVTADPLPTVQINGVVWSQVVVGNTVYVGGEFTKARPAGAPAGTNETTRNNLLAYDIRTGELIQSFAPDLNGQVRAVVASPDGSRVYVGGSFTKANGQTRYRIAAYNTATGALDPSFKPAFASQVKAIAVSNSTVYAGGIFDAVGSQPRTRLAAVTRSNGALLPWAPAADAAVNALVLSPSGTKVIAGGSFATLGGPVNAGGQVAQGIGAIDASTGQAVPFAAGRVVNNTGSTAAVLSLSVDADTVYGSGYTYGKGNLEGVVAAHPETGAVRWIEDCRGDSYSVWASGTVAYVAGHPHVCSNIGGWPQEEPWTFYRGIAFSKAATGKVGAGSFTGQPAPSLLNWFPTIDAGTYTGQTQGPWSVAGNSQYVVYGGEFPRVNGVAQQGLVRFAAPSIAPNKVGPSGNQDLVPGVASLAPGTARVGWLATHDRDSENLTYRMYRDGNTITPVYQVTQASRFWNRPKMAYTDRGLSAGTHRYRLTVSDPMGNTVTTAWTSVDVAAGSTPARRYADTVRADGARNHWPLGETSGPTAYDHISADDAAISGGVTLGRTGAVSGDRDTAGEFGGSNGLAATATQIPGPGTFSIEAWFQTTSSAGGKIVGFGNRNSGNSTSYDRHVYMDKLGRVTFGVYTGAERTVVSPKRYNDGAWHHVVATFGSSGMGLYVDGEQVGSRTDATSAQNYSGYWRIGGDSSWGGNGQYFNGRIDEVAIYPGVLSAERARSHYTLGATGEGSNVEPTAAFTSSTAQLTATFDASGSSDSDGTIASAAWTFGDGSTGTGMTTTHTYAEAGTYPVTLTVTDDDGATAQRSGTVTVTAPPANVAPVAAFTAAVSGLAVSVDGAGSTDSDGSVASYAWEFGDGATGTGATASHAYAAAGTYPVRLTVVDDDGAVGTVTKSVTVTAPPVDPGPGEAPVAVAVDDFGRTVASGFGSAATGGAWSVSGGARSVSDGVGHLQVNAAGGSSAAWLNSVSVTDVAVQMGISLDAAPTGAGTYVYVTGRRTSGGHYRAVVRFLADGTTRLSLSRVVSNAETTLRTVVLPGTYTPGTVMQVRLDLSGTGTTTLNAKAWAAGTPEPGTWQVSATDTTASLQGAGGIGVTAYVSGSATVVPVRVNVDDLWAGPAGSKPPVA
jgi:PKD repeat protein